MEVNKAIHPVGGSPTPYEYRTEQFSFYDIKDLDPQLNRMARAGYRPISVIKVNGSPMEYKFIITFERKKEDNAPRTTPLAASL